MRRAAAMLACALLASCASSAAPRQVLLPGVYDFPLYEGTSIPETCRWVEPPEDPARSACVLVPPSIGLYAQSGYLELITTHGWEFVSGDDDSFWFNRPIPNTDCADRMHLSGGYDATPEQVAAWETDRRFGTINGLFFFSMRREPVCGRERYQ